MISSRARILLRSSPSRPQPVRLVPVRKTSGGELHLEEMAPAAIGDGRF